MDSIIEYHINFQRYLERYPGTVGPTYNWLQGELETLEYLWAYKGEEDKISAILISASLFSRLKSSRRMYPRDHWPPYFCVQELLKWAYSQWNAERQFSTWQHYHTQVLPHINWDHKYKLDDMNALVFYLAEEHAEVFLNYTPNASDMWKFCLLV
ncbi:hypothetical protein [Syntrophomonas wolfei]|uniref:hypothetical protein n=1 Tax=Syntrophomonas wolfei TaxID=863 RepID=UPI0013655D5F|nr:hypothetical protein [Syntrophomonas wolfei]